jgi:hypothetical protein
MLAGQRQAIINEHAPNGETAMFEELDRNQIKILTAAIIGDALAFFCS